LGRFAPTSLDRDGKVILVTGGTGSFGRRFVETVLERARPR
jgi:UDP-N-acetylglucosamine 4,6-dehydratase